MLIEEGTIRILIDPGAFSTTQNEVKNIDVVLITHEHFDHYYPDSLKKVLFNNPQAKIYTNASVFNLLEKEDIKAEVLAGGESVTEKGILIEGIGNDHGQFHSTIPPVRNTGYRIASRFFYSGDSLTRPGKPVDILALPVAGPWAKMSEIIDFALAIKPKITFPVHEEILKDPNLGFRWPPQVLEPAGIPFQILELGKEYEF